MSQVKDKPKVTKIIITIGGKEIACTPEDLKDLKRALEEMYPTERQTVVPMPYPVPTRPWYERTPIVSHWSNNSGSVSLYCKN